ncbi:gamma-glutamyl-gamma-aminobutyrate hydrolase family protein [Thalassococcus sp. CAU 1522]|uniref:Gamma-glutamyl-gamma-aminobutyrate hydrolase family protein n=1 Tax=Thalassococcus arenae TaxID=2851652 RepID=A0ABS6N3Z4_9RHOB|nr:gamma-glutamyl-gamma-aminobutyrate hydrolase family protein [Thalassococcus arenae]MBV2358382.1 gamma-glutamyl-gamma-aminobutyrate hydrolase family protein [Thalassococcus arenae]
MVGTRPVIGVTTSRRSGWRVFPLVRFNVWLVGGRAIRWTSAADVDLGAVDGIIIGGGDDISPELYGASVKLTARLDPDRDRMERDIARQAVHDGIPVLGICRGAQMLNVAQGGSLHQDAWPLFENATPIKTILPRRDVEIAPGSRLAKIAGDAPMRVNALHTQAVDQLGTDLRIAARDLHGMVQAIERVRDPFALGVQWHPEHLFYAHRQRALFRALVRAARAYRTDAQQIPLAVGQD